MLSFCPESRPGPKTQIQRLPLQRDPSHGGLRRHHVHVSGVQPAPSAPRGPHPPWPGAGVSQTALQQPALPLPPRAPGADHRGAGHPEASFRSGPSWKLERHHHVRVGTTTFTSPPLCSFRSSVVLCPHPAAGHFASGVRVPTDTNPYRLLLL